MALTIGSAGLDVDLTSPSSWDVQGDEVDFSLLISPDGETAATRVEEQTILVEQLQGMVGSPDTPVVPVTWDAWPAVDGFYRIESLDLGMVGASLAGAPWRLRGRLRRVSAFASPVVESRLQHVVRTDTAVAASAADPLAGVPGDATVYRRGTVGLGGLTSRSVEYPTGSGSAGSVLVDVWAGTDDQADAEWQVAPAGFYVGAAQINRVLSGGIGDGTRAILGRQVPGGLDPNTGWSLGNGLMSVLPSEAVGGTAGTITVLSWAGTAYESGTEIEFRQAGSESGTEIEFHQAGSDNSPDSLVGLSILRNSPEVTTVRLITDAADGFFFTIDLTVRRGDRMVQGVLRAQATSFLAAGVFAGSAQTAITGGVRQTSNDADGNRWVLTSTAVINTNGLVTGSGAVDLLDFGFGHEIGGSSATGIETAQALANQYAAHVGQTDQIVVP